MADNKERGLYAKYRVSRVDGKPVQDCMVLEFKDPNARAGIRSFSAAVRADGHERLADDIDLRLEDYDKSSGGGEV